MCSKEWQKDPELMSKEAMAIWINSRRMEFNRLTGELRKVMKEIRAIRGCANCGGAITEFARENVNGNPGKCLVGETMIDDQGRCMICGHGYSISGYGPPLPPGRDIKAMLKEIRKPMKPRKEETACLKKKG